MIFSQPSHRNPSRAVPPVAATQPANVRPRLTMKPLEAIRCTQPTCHCECFAPGKQSLRYCGNCSHGWVAHALDKLGPNHALNLGLHVEVVQPNIVFDIASLMLYGAHATPVRLKILLDRLFSVLQHEEVLQILHGFGWTYEDYARGYILQNSTGRVLDKWCVATQEEELVVLQQFLRFGETKAIAQEIILQDTKDRQDILSKHGTTAESDIKKFIDRSNLSSMQNYIKSYESTRQLFASTPITYIPPASRIAPPSFISHNFSSPGVDSRFAISHVSPTMVASMGPSPLHCPQVLQRFGSPKEQPSPAINLSIDCRNANSSPRYDSPHNLSTASTVASVGSPPQHQPLRHQPQNPNEVDDNDLNLSASDDDEEALDYSNKDNQDSPTDERAKGKHVRKSTHPIKRQWTPSVNFGNTFIGPNGKKRVLCTACNKTFCDKGALKIHYSAVHLKEMHKCSVEGCNMMFSSRRSRNRHSANPNPKLHMPQKRKDDLDQSLEADTSVANGSFSSTTPTKSASTSSPVPSLTESPHVARSEPNFLIGSSSAFSFLPRPEKRLKLEDDQPADMSKPVVPPPLNNDEPFDLSKKLDDEVKLEIDLDKCSDDNEDVALCDGDVNGNRVKTSAETGIKGGKRRKNTAPLRCAQVGAPQHDDAASSTVFYRRLPLDLSNGIILDLNEPTPCIRKQETFSLSEQHETRNMNNNAYGDQDQVGENERSHDDASLSSHDSQEKRNGRQEASNFPKMASLLWANSARTDSTNVSEDELHDEHYQASDKDFDKDEEDNSKLESSDLGANMSDSESHIFEDDESQTSNEIGQDFPPEAYADTENPLKCRLCGKIFQNNFTVKIHFQNVHLKLMHPCTVNGCTSAFPSKRSRNRHSANLNLHRQMFSENREQKLTDVRSGSILARSYGQELDSMVSNTATAEVRDERSAKNNNEDLNKGHERSFLSINSGHNFSCSSPTTMTIQNVVNGHTSKPSSAGSAVIYGDYGREGNSSNEAECLIDNTFKVQGNAYDVKFSNSAVLQDHGSIPRLEQEHSLPGPLVRKAVSPHRAYSRLSMA